VPVAVKGTDKLARLGRLSVAYGAPVEIDDLRGGDIQSRRMRRPSG